MPKTALSRTLSPACTPSPARTPSLASDIDIGARLKAIRTARQMSQRELARKSGVTNGLISQIEQNLSSPSVSSLKRILDAIPLSLSSFFMIDPAAEQTFFRAEDLAEQDPAALFPAAGEAAGEALALLRLQGVGGGAGHRLQLHKARFAPGADSGAVTRAQAGETAGMVVEGRLEVTVGAETADLGPGDAFFFDTRRPHRFRNNSTTDCLLITASDREDG